MQIEIKFKSIGKSPKEILEEIKRSQIKLFDELEQLGKDGSDYMQNYIATNKTFQHKAKDTEPIENNIDTTIKRTEEDLFIGIGNIDKLNKESKHWKVINYGKIGVDDEGQGGEVRHPAGGNRIPIKPMNYIENTIFFINKNINSILKKFKG